MSRPRAPRRFSAALAGLPAPSPRPPYFVRGWQVVRQAGLWAACLLAVGCGYSTHAALPASLETLYVQPFVNKINLASMPTRDERFPLYRHRMEVDLTNAVISRFQFTGLLRPATPERADARLEGDLVGFRRDALRYDASKLVEEWRLNVVVTLRFYDQKSQTLLWEEQHFTGDTTYFAAGPNTETEDSALSRAMTDLARRIVERTVENW